MDINLQKMALNDFARLSQNMFTGGRRDERYSSMYSFNFWIFSLNIVINH